MEAPSTAIPARSDETVAFSPPYERNGATLITAAAVRTHSASRGDGDGARPSGFDATLSGSRPLGAFVVRDGRVRWHTALDWTRIVTTAEVMVGGAVIARRLAARPGSTKALVTMGPGGWVSMKGGVMAVRPAERGWLRRRQPPVQRTRRPWWARLLAATTLESVLRR